MLNMVWMYQVLKEEVLNNKNIRKIFWGKKI